MQDHICDLLIGPPKRPLSVQWTAQGDGSFSYPFRRRRGKPGDGWFKHP